MTPAQLTDPNWLSTLTPEEFASAMHQVAMSGREDAELIRKEMSATYTWIQQQKQNEDTLNAQEEANDPLRQVGMFGAGTATGALATQLANKGVDALFSNSKPAVDTTTTTGQLSSQPIDTTLPSSLEYNGSSLYPSGAQASTATGAPPAASTNVQGSALDGSSAAGATGAEEGGSMMGAVAPYLALAGALYGQYNSYNSDDEKYQNQGQSGVKGTLRNWKDYWNDVRWDHLSNFRDNLWEMTLPGGVNSLAQGAAGAFFGSGKDQDQKMRDMVRGNLEKSGFFNSDPQLNDDDVFTFSDGSTFDFSKDNGHKLDNFSPDGEFGAERNYYDVDWSNPGAGGVVGLIDPLVYTMMPGEDMEKLRSQYAGYFVNAAQGGTNPEQRVRELYDKAGLDRNSAAEAVWKMYNDGQLTQEQRNAQLASVDRLYGIENPNAGKGGAEEFGNALIKPGEENLFSTGEEKQTDEEQQSFEDENPWYMTEAEQWQTQQPGMIKYPNLMGALNAQTAQQQAPSNSGMVQTPALGNQSFWEERKKPQYQNLWEALKLKYAG
jgi:hypothetical protein